VAASSSLSSPAPPDVTEAPPDDGLDVLLALLVGAAWLLDALVVGSSSAPEPVAACAAIAAALLLVQRRAQPLVVSTGVWVVLMVQTALGVDADASVVPALAVALAMFALGRHERPDRALTGLLGAVMAAYALVLSLPDRSLADAVFASVAFLVPFLAGHLLQRARHDGLAERDDARRELVRRHAASPGVAWQREQIAAETLAVLRAEHGTPGDHDATLRRLAAAIGVPVPDDERLPGLDDVPRLLDTARRAGAEVDWREDGEPVALAADLQLALHRILEEALTNVVEHADPPRATATLRWEEDVVELEVLDDGRPPTGDPGRGQGLLAMRERARTCGGTFYAGRRPSGGYRIRVRLPLDPDQPAARTRRTAPSATTSSPSRS
jgi:signal transduction histidine kinase